MTPNAGTPLRVGPSAAHLCIDMQNLFAAGGPWETPWLPEVLPRIAMLARQYPERTIFTRFIPPFRPETAPGQWRVFYEHWPQVTRQELPPRFLDLVPALEGLVPPAQVIDKPAYSAFAETDLAARLRRRGVDTLILTGTETDVCVLTTALDAVDMGYRVIVVKDALCSSKDQTHDALLKLYATRFKHQIELVSVHDLLAQWT